MIFISCERELNKKRALEGEALRGGVARILELQYVVFFNAFWSSDQRAIKHIMDS